MSVQEINFHELDGLYAKLEMRAKAHETLSKISDGHLQNYLMPEERALVAAAKAYFSVMLQPETRSPVPAPTPQATPVPLHPATAVDIGETNPEYWNLPTWGRSIVQAEPEDNRDAMIMDIRNAIDSAGEDRARAFLEKAGKSENNVPTRLAETAANLMQSTKPVGA